jgi:LPS export ABC transporter protein LptC
MKKALIFLVIIAATAIFWIYRERYGGKADSQKAVRTESPEKLQELDQKVLSFRIDGRSPKDAKQWHLEGNSAEIRGETIYLNDLKAIAYGENVTANLTSDTGIYNKEKGEVELIGNVKVFTDDGFTLTTEQDKWSQMTKEIFTDNVVHITQEGMSAVGKGGTANSDEKTATLKEDVVVMMEPDTRVDCDGPLEVNYNENVAVFYENVKVEDKDGKLFADKLTVNFDPESKKLSQVTAEGNVKVKKGKSYTISEKAIYTESTKSAQLLGRPRVIIDPAELAQLDEMGKHGMMAENKKEGNEGETSGRGDQNASIGDQGSGETIRR